MLRYSILFIYKVSVFTVGFAASWDLFQPNLISNFANEDGWIEYQVKIERTSTDSNLTATTELNKIYQYGDDHYPELIDFPFKAISFSRTVSNDMLLIGLEDTSNISLHAAMQDTFVVHEQMGIEGWLDTVVLDSFIGFTDSVRTYLFNNGDYYLISKSYGLVEFSVGGEELSLVGFENLGVGETTLSWQDIYLFDPGNTLIISGGNELYGDGYRIHNYTTRFEIHSADLKVEEVTYHGERWGRSRTDYHIGPPSEGSGYSGPTSITFGSSNFFIGNHLLKSLYPTFCGEFGIVEYEKSNDLKTKYFYLPQELSYGREIYAFFTEGNGHRKSDFCFEYGEHESFGCVGATFDGCGGSTSKESFIVSVRDLIKVEGVALYPNPVQNQLNLTSAIAPIEGVELYNTSGKLIYEDQGTESEVMIDVSNLESGLYLIQAKINGELHRSKVLVK